MVYLKRIELYGFKSFVERITLDFNNGITAIVGPNGSGKSNITDAIRWVMGEQSAKSLRGSRMEDVIFAGTEKRKPLNYAEVSLTLDNEDHMFPLDFLEITVTRRVYRSGEGEYFINKAPCRLRDIHELFMDTGLGRDGYSVIGQGQVDAVLSAKSEDRRQIFEEAAGISKYKYRKIESEKKLAATEENLVRIHDIAGQLGERIPVLEEQSKKAKKYLEIHDELKSIEVNLALFSIEKLRAVSDETEKLFESINEDITEAKENLAGLSLEEQTLYGDMRLQDAQMESLRDKFHASQLAAKESEGEIALLRNSIENASLNIEKNEREKEQLKLELLQLEKYKASICENIESIRKKQSEMNDELESRTKQLDEFGNDIDAKNTHLSQLSSIVLEINAEIEDISRRISDMDSFEGGYRERFDELTQQKLKAENNVREAESNLITLSELLMKKEEEFKKLNDEYEKLLKKKPETESEIACLKRVYNEVAQDYNRKSSRHGALSDMEKTMEGYSKGVKAVLETPLNADVRGVLSKLIKTEEKYITAIETALGGALQNIVVGSEEDAKKAIEFLKRERLGRATFLPVTSVTGRRLDMNLNGQQGFIALGCDLVTSDYKDIVLNLLGTTVIVDNMDNAVRIAKKYGYKFRIVTLEGELLSRGGSISGGSHSNTFQLLSRTKEIEELFSECAKLERKMEKAEEKIDEKTDELADLVHELEIIRDKRMAIDNEKMKAENESSLKKHLAENERHLIKRLEEDLESAARRMENSDSERIRLANQKLEAEGRLKAAKANAESAREQLHKMLLERDKLQEELMKFKLLINSSEKDIEMAEEQYKAAENDIRKASSRVMEKAQEKLNIEKTIEELSLRIKNKKINIDDAEKRAEIFRNEIENLAEKKSGADEAALKLRQNIKEQNERLLVLQAEHGKLSNRLTKAGSDLDSYITRLWDDYELTYSTAVSQRKDIGNITAAKEKAAELKRAVKSLGNINVNSIDEYKEVKERFDFLTNQIADLEKAKAELLKIIEEMTKVMKSTFEENFKIISEHFKVTFSELFGGGTAKLSLAEPSNILESGIEIDVQPPGKKLQSLTLLSGGEKALTAIAILFSVLKVRPTPFCILDEIESALDDHNIIRFANYLQRYENTQFVIVTHRRGTMEAADILYGVAMQEKGVSKVLSMHLD